MIKEHIPFDQYQRYQTVANLISFHRANNADRQFTILELGANEHKNLQLFLPNDQILFTDIVLNETMQKDSDFLCADGSRLPFCDDRFDFVVASDVLEHVPADRRAAFFTEAYRVSKLGVIFCFPYHSQLVTDAEARVNTYYKTVTGKDYIWLKEHAENQLPQISNIEELLNESQINHFSFYHGNLELWEKMWYCHFNAEFQPRTRGYTEQVDHYYNAHIYDKDIRGNCYRVFYVLSKVKTEQWDNYTKQLWNDHDEITSSFLDSLLQAHNVLHAEVNNIEKNSAVNTQPGTFVSRAYFDKGAGFDFNEINLIYQNSKENSLDLKIELPEGTTQIRIDPIDNACCLLEDVSVTDENGNELEYLIGNGFRTFNTCIFGHIDSQIHVALCGVKTRAVHVRAARICFDKSEIARKLYDLKQASSDPGFAYNAEQIEHQLTSPELNEAYRKLETELAVHQIKELQKKYEDHAAAQSCKMAELKSMFLEQKDENQQLTATLQKHQQEYAELVLMLQKQLRESADINSMLQKQLRDTHDSIFMSKNIQNLVNDLLYVTPHSPWYQKALRRAEHPTIFYRLARSLRVNGFWGTGKKAVKKIIKKIYRFSRRHNWLKRPLKLLNRVFQKLFPKWGSSVNTTLYEAKLQLNQAAFADGLSRFGGSVIWQGEKPVPFAEKPLVSIIVPNYNHSAYLRDRLESVYNQTYPNFEVILLDDCSTDNSREILLEYAHRYPEKTIVDFNEVNGGKVFKQWNKGINHAKGKLIWIAESDDWCELDFLEKMVPHFEYQSVMLAFCNSIFMQDGAKCWSLAEYLSDIPQLHFDQPFMMSAHIAVNTAFAIKNIVPNVSSAMFRNTGVIPKEITDIWQDIRLCGDWLFYLHTIKGGTISYTNETTNYYRIHKNSTSLNIQKKPEYYQEQEKISKYVVQNYDVDLKTFDKVLYNLEQHYREVNDTNDVTVVHENYSIARIAAVAGNRRPSVLMCCYSLQIGGGETYPIVLANEMKEQGIAVTFLNFNLDSYSEQIRGMIDAKVPVITLEKTDYLGSILTQTGADIVHSHHASVDTMLSFWLRAMDTKCRQIVTLHGMYETMESENCKKSFETLAQTCKKFIYIADKNLTQIDTLGYRDCFDLVKIGNGLPQIDVTPVDRASLGIDENDFVFCVVSRALPQKGWQEAADAVIEANKTSKRKIHLILVGDGEMRKKLSTLKSPYVHLVGQRSNVRDYFATSDMGLLPSTYKGESFPLVIIECMLTGNPVLSSNLGEVKHQLTAEDGELAGMLIELNDWKLDVDELSSMMVQVANDEALYQKLRSRVPSASEKFDITKIVHQHLDIYTNASIQK